MLSEKDINYNKIAYWTEGLEQVLNASSIAIGGIRSFIANALAFGPPDSAKKLLQQQFQRILLITVEFFP
jgi:hypothetical protein